LIDLKKEKLINAIIYFVKNTKNCRKMKLFKLLYFLDFIHFKQYGTTVTGLEYFAWPKGPVPLKLYNDFSNEDKKQVFKDYFKIYKETDEEDPEKYSFKIVLNNKNLDMSVFTPREKKILDDVAFIFKDSTASEMSEISHLKNEPWDKTIKLRGQNSLIDYLLAIDKESPLTVEEVKERYQLEKELEAQ
jgi:uncharacterized phage-associated protein